MRKLLLSGIALCALTLFAAPAHAAFISWDDSDPNTITVTAGDFENGFSVDGVLLTSGLGASGSVTLPDGGHSFEGSWIDLGLSGGHVEILFALPGNPTGVTSGVTYDLTTDGSNGTISGAFGGFVGGVYFTTAGPTFAQDGHTESFSAPFLSESFTSEAVPEPATLLLGVPGVLLAIRRRTRR